MQCIICHKVIEETFNSLFSDRYRVCYKCFEKFKIREITVFIDNVECFIVYYYDEFFKELLYKCKGCYDYVLKDAFLTYNLKKIRSRYKGYTIVLAPSNVSGESKRGFNHLNEIFKNLNFPIINCFYKTKEWKQSDKKFDDRHKIQNVIKIDKQALKGIKKVLIVDDVLTSGATIKAMIKQIPSNIDKKVLVLSSNCKFLSNKSV